MKQIPRITYLLNRYLDNCCTRQEMDELLDHIQRNPEDEHLTSVLREHWDSEKFFTHAEGVSWDEMEKRLHETALNGSAWYRQGFLWKVAASILLLATCFSGFFFWNENENASLAENQHLLKNSVETANDEHRLIVLSDGSKVWINGNSKLISAPAFNNSKREVTLYGEAFFDIRHDPNRPFIIKTGSVNTTVLGTAFNIRAFPEENAVTVTVTRGKVRVEAENKKGGTVEANQQITLDLQTKQLESYEVDAAVVSQWIKDDLILHEITLDDIEEILEDRYSVDIRFNNPLLTKCRFTSTFFQDASLNEVLTAICLVNRAEYKIDHDLITIYGKGCE